MSITPLIICGAFGRMGQALIELGLTMPHISIKGACIKKSDPRSKPSHWPFSCKDNLDFFGPAVLVDFSHSSQVFNNLEQALQKKWPILIGTTGHSVENLEYFKQAAKSLPVLYAPNTSIMANLLINFSSEVARVTNTFVHLIDIHHKDKKDAPSGTALAIKKSLNQHMKDEKITLTSLRVANIVGEHQLRFFKENEQLDISHRVNDRVIFAEGALIAAEFLYGVGPGLYDMNDVLNLK